MDAPAPPSRLELLLALSSHDLREDLVHLAYRRCRKWDDAKELVNQAIVFVIGTHASGWNRARHADLPRYLASVVNRLSWARHVRTIHGVREGYWSLEKFDRKASSPRNAEEAALDSDALADERKRAEMRLWALRGNLRSLGTETSAVALRVIDVVLDGKAEARDQADALGVTPAAVERAREQIVECLDDLLGEESAESSEMRP